MASKKKRTKTKSLSHGRPPTAKPVRAISSKATRTLIRTHHTLEKQKAAAIASGDEAKAALISKQIEEQGGIESYQKASLLGQANDRGGDSSKILMEWMKPFIPALKTQVAAGKPLRMLEVGALSTTNACSRSRLFEMERIDLNSQETGILQQDFMERPLPMTSTEKFEIISLSLVLNFVPDAAGRGEMLRRTLKFLNTGTSSSEDLSEVLPSLFLVLPAPCITNSRYMDGLKLSSIMESLGYIQVSKKLSNKLVYFLWRLEATEGGKPIPFKKEEVRNGSSRNNFAIVLT